MSARFWLPLAALLAIAPRAPQRPDSARAARHTTPFPDTLATLSAGGASTCLTTTAGAAWCWGPFDRRNGAVARVVGTDGQPARLRSLATAVISFSPSII